MLEEIEETTKVSDIIVVFLLNLAWIQLCQGLFRVLPLNLDRLPYLS